MNKKFITGLLIGAAAGAVLGILFAPAKGSETRKNLTKKGEDLKENIAGLKNKLSEKYREIRKQAESVLHNGQEA